MPWLKEENEYDNCFDFVKKDNNRDNNNENINEKKKN